MIDQRSEEWLALRAGRITASRMNDVMAFTAGDGQWKSGPRKGQDKVATPLKSRADYALQLAAERLTGKPRKQVKAYALQWGQDVEPLAQSAYEAATGVIVDRAEFMIHPLHDFIGASPDFLVDADGGGEIKSPESSEVHLETLLRGLPKDHIEQIQGGLWVTGRLWWDFVSFHPDFQPAQRLYIQRVQRDDDYIGRLEAACLSLEEEVRQIIHDVVNGRQAA